MRVKVNGLACAYRRIVEETSKRVDPVVECLCFFGLWLFPMGGTGRLARQRGWVGPPYRRHAFLWPAWSPALDRWAIDALLDLVHRAVPAGPLDSGRKLSPALRRAGVTTLYGSVPYRSLGSNDTTRGYAGERVA